MHLKYATGHILFLKKIKAKEKKIEIKTISKRYIAYKN